MERRKSEVDISYHLSRFKFLLNNVKKTDANNVNHKPDKGFRKTLCKENVFEDHLGRNSLTS